MCLEWRLVREGGRGRGERGGGGMCLEWRVVREGGRGRGERGEVCVSSGDWLGREVEGGERGGEVCVSCGEWLGREVEGGERGGRYVSRVESG